MRTIPTLATWLPAAAACLALLASCASYIPVDTEHKSQTSDHVNVINLRYVTNRALISSRSNGRYYDDRRGELSAGICTVGFEARDRSGEVLSVETAPVDNVLDGLATGRVIVYVHGYSETFDRSCRRAAMLQSNLRLDDRLVLFSWPSSNFVTYTQDAADLSASLDDLNRFITQAAQVIGHDRIVLMAHSMGSRGVVDALRQRDGDVDKFSEAVFVAPDIRRDLFVENVQMLQSKVSDLTVYASDNDLVLWLSTIVNVSGRLGVATEIDIDAEHMRIIDISSTGVNFIGGHLYHIFNPAVAEDLRALFGSGPPGASRAWQRVPGATDSIWRLEKG